MRFVIFDGHAAMYRAVFVRGHPLTSPSGELTRGTYYFTRTLIASVRQLKPDYILFATDTKRSELFRRTNIYKEYKATREERGPMDEELLIQLQRMKEIVKLLDVPMAHAWNWEADDVIATLVDCFKGTGVETVIVARDKDMQQLICDDVKMYDPHTSTWMDEQYVIDKWGVPPKKLKDVLALAGDSADNIPGVKGVGPKTAAKLVNEHGDCIAAAKYKGYDLENVEMCLRLVTLKNDCDIEGVKDLDELEFEGFDYDGAAELFRELGFKRFK